MDGEEMKQVPHIDEVPIENTAAMAKMMVQLVCDELNALGVPNYLTLGIADENGLTYQFTVRRPGCETAEDQVVQLTKEVSALRFEVARFKAEKNAADAAKLKGGEPLVTVDRDEEIPT